MPDSVDCYQIYRVNTQGRCERTRYRSNAEYAGADGGTADFIDLGVYEHPGWDTSTALAEALAAQGAGQLFTSWPPPRNAAVFWDGSAIGHPDGHTAASVGDGSAMTTDFPWGEISQMSIDDITNATGYRYMGWSPKFGGFDIPHLGAVSTSTTTAGGVGYNGTGRTIEDIQTALNAQIDAGLTVDGSYGPATTEAVKDFQADHGLTVDGIYGPMTDQALFPPAFTHVSDPVDVDGDEGRQTAAKEQAALGVTVDAIRGPETIMAEQRLTGATVDGIDGPDTATHLQQYLTGLGYPVTVDGERGPETIAAMQRALNDGRFGQPVPAETAPNPALPAEPATDTESPTAPTVDETGQPEPTDIPTPPASDLEVPSDAPTPLPEEPTMPAPLTPGDADTLRTGVVGAIDTIPTVELTGAELGAVVTDTAKRATIYSWTMLVGIGLKMLGAGVGAAVTSGFAIWAALTLGIAEQAQTALAPWLPLIVVLVAVFAFVTGAYAVWAQQVVALARANTK